jgi:hypothetical protein
MLNPHAATPSGGHVGSKGFVQLERRTKITAFLFALMTTAMLIGATVLVSAMRDRASPIEETFFLVPLPRVAIEERKLPEQQPVEQAEVLENSLDEAAPSSLPRTVAPAPALPVVPPNPFDLAENQLQPVPNAGVGREAFGKGSSQGNQAEGPIGRGGTGGDGLGGNGKGGAGNGKGKGSELIASWAPGMDFSQNYRFYPRKALRARIEGVAWLRCFVLRRDRVRDCRLVAEEPAGHGFGQAALKTERQLRVRVHNQSGRRIYNEWVTVRSFFVLPKLEARSAEPEQEDEADNDPQEASDQRR